MRRCSGHIVLITLLLLCSIKAAMAQNRNSLSISSDHLTLQIDLQSSQSSLDSILNIAGINTANSARILKVDFTVLGKDGWELAERQDNIARFERSLNSLNVNPQDNPY